MLKGIKNWQNSKNFTCLLSNGFTRFSMQKNPFIFFLKIIISCNNTIFKNFTFHKCFEHSMCFYERQYIIPYKIYRVLENSGNVHITYALNIFV